MSDQPIDVNENDVRLAYAAIKLARATKELGGAVLRIAPQDDGARRAVDEIEEAATLLVEWLGHQRRAGSGRTGA